MKQSGTKNTQILMSVLLDPGSLKAGPKVILRFCKERPSILLEKSNGVNTYGSARVYSYNTLLSIQPYYPN